ncbi:MAG: HNH endonuclease [Streptococcaceae bacterium]|nr:HNH endonuclease [Streptococcaceae bacterium]MCL2681303.1 HNH endonuclease [Streptococcaceae bacterium]
MTEIHSKRASETQNYENYWKLTVEYSDIYAPQFNNVLKMIVQFIDNEKLSGHELSKSEFSKAGYYKELQEQVGQIYTKADGASTRKSLNQFVKLGFVSPFLRGYHNLTKQFLKASGDEKKLIFSQIFYAHSSFNSTVTIDETTRKEMNFLVKTLMYHSDKKLNRNDIIALMNVDISAVSKGYLTKDELTAEYKMANVISFESRKYNQIRYFLNFLKLLPGIVVSRDNEITYEENAEEVLTNNIDTKRDQTLFRLMKENLFRESREFYNGKVVCYFTKKEQKGLVVSHIYASAEALKNLDVEAAYDYRNALLLERNTDMYFDKHDLSFDISGLPLFGLETTVDFENDHINNKLDDFVLYPERLEYMEIHRKIYEKKQKNLVSP